MSRFQMALLILTGLLSAPGCQRAPSENEVDRVLKELNVMEDTEVSELMLTKADPAESVNFFQRGRELHPDRIDLLRGLARSLARSSDVDASVAAWRAVASHPDAAPEDHVELAEILLKLDKWSEASAALAAVPPTYESFKRFRLEAVLADSQRNWKKADSFYQSAISLTSTPASTYNNWGYSKLTRGAFADAERLFLQALSHDPTLFTAKNNLVMARAGMKNYQLPVIEMAQQERAELLYTMALTAIKQGDTSIGKTLLREAIDAHPLHFESAVRSLRAMEG